MRRVLVLIAAAGVVALLLWLQGGEDGRVERSGTPTSTVDEVGRNGASTTEPEAPRAADTQGNDDDPRRVPGPDVVLTGRVEHNGERVPDAVIEARRYDEPIAISESRTGGDGTFRVTIARRSRLVLSARDADGRCASVLLLVPDEGDPDEVVIRLKDAHPFGGIILNPDGTPHAGATVRLIPDPEWYAYATKTAADGRFAFAHVSSGAYEVHIEAQGFPVIRRFADVPGLRDFKATLFTGGSIRGKLRDDMERPIGGATITLHSGDGRKSPAGIATVDTQADGSFHMPDVMPGPCWNAVVSHSDWGRRLSAYDEVALPVEPVRAGDELTWNMTLPSYSTLVVRAVAEESGAPIEGALVSVVPTRHYQSDQWRARTERTDARGIASFPHTTHDGVYVQLEHRCRMMRRGDELVDGRPVYADEWRKGVVDLKCAPAGMVEGRIRRDISADPELLGIRLILGANDYLWTDVDRTGRFRFPAAPESLGAFIVADTAQLKSRRFDIVAGERTWVDVDLPHKAAVTGVVFDEARDPVEGARVRIVPTKEVEAVVRRTEERKWRWKWAETTNERGEFAIFSAKSRRLREEDAGTPGKWSVVVLHPDYRPLRKDGLNTPDEDAPQTLSLELSSGESIQGSVYFETGQPAPNIPIEALPEAAARQAPRRVMSDSQGRFTLRGLDAGSWALKALHGEGVSRPMSARAGARGIRIAIEMHSPIVGLLLDDEDRPIGGALVELSRRRQTNLTARTQPNGRFRIEHAPPGRHRLRIRPSQWITPKGLQGSPHFPAFDSEPIVAGTEEIVLRVERGNVLSGRVLDAIGKTVARATIVAHLDEPWAVVADADGEFSIKVADDEPVTIYATGTGHPIRATQIIPGSRPREIRLPPGGSIRGRVLDDAGRPIKGALVRARAEAGSLDDAGRLSRPMLDALRIPARWTATSAEEGTFTIRNIEAGAYELTVESSNGASATARVQTDGPSTTLQLAR